MWKKENCWYQTQGRTSSTVAASLHPLTDPDHSYVRTLFISAEGLCVYSQRESDHRVCVIVCHPCLFSLQIHLYVTFIFFPQFICSFLKSLPPCFDLFFSVFSPTCSQSLKHAHAPIYPPSHGCSWHGWVPDKLRGLAWDYAKKYKNRCSTAA